MTPAWGRRWIALSVGQRLFLGLLPSLLAVTLVVGLAYYGQYARAAPAVVVVAAAALAVASLALTALNARHLARRIGRLAGHAPVPVAGVDELDRIEEVVDRLGSALSASEAERERAHAAGARRLHEQTTALAATVRDAVARLDDVRLPLHILLESRFGDINENQEELLRDATDAAGALDAALRRLSTIADADRGALGVRLEPLQVNDVVRAVLPLARAAAERRGARIAAELEPGLPRVRADRARLAEALALLLDVAARGAGPDRALGVSTARLGRAIAIVVAPAGDSAPGADETSVLLATRLVAAQGGSVERTPLGMEVRVG